MLLSRARVARRVQRTLVSRCFQLPRAVLLGSALVLAELPAAAADPAVGWHGEALPEGLVRGEADGEYLWQRDGSVMVYVAAGEFLMGSVADEPGAGRDEQPQRRVHQGAFYIDKHEVTWGQWKLSGLPWNNDPHSRLPEPRAPDWGIVAEQPVVNVSWHDARAYLAWAGKRLPTEAEWEKAARGTDGRRYPWGDEPPTFERAVWRPHPIAAESTAAADCCPAGASPYGVRNLAGNVYEWCEDVYDKGFYRSAPATNPVRRGEGRYRVLRGGAFVLEEEDLRSAYRYRLLADDRTPYIGFRGALSAAVSSGE